MFLGFINPKISNKPKLPSLSNLPPIFSQPLPILGKMYPPSFVGEKTELQSPSPL